MTAVVTTAQEAPAAEVAGEDVLVFVAQGTAGTVGEQFFKCLVEHLARAFGADVGFVAEVMPEDRRRARFLACWEGGRHVAEPGEYELAGTPCAEFEDSDVVFYSRGVRDRFPEDEMVQVLGLDSYLAVGLRGSDGAHLGQLGVLGAAALPPDDRRVAVLQIFAARAASEVERRQREQALRESEAAQRALADELAASRVRIVEAGDEARRRIERDLHDGAQQRFLAATCALRLLRDRLADSSDESGAMLDQVHDELLLALDELRELAHGIHPAVLSTAGLGPALKAVATRSSIPVTVLDVPTRRLPTAVEVAGYFVVAEALTNVAKYAEATAATVRAVEANGALVVEVSDDGVGGAEPARGTGIRGLIDRLDALGGGLRVDSPRGRGTTLVATIPVGQHSI